MWCGSMASAFQIVEVERRFLEQLDRISPPIPHDLFRFAVSRFQSDAKEPPLSQSRDELDRIAEAAGLLAAALASASPAAQGAMLMREQLHGARNARISALQDLRTLAGVAEMARRDVEQRVGRGAPMAKNTILIADLAAAIRAQGCTADAKPQGPLVLAFGIALEACGESVSDPAKTVESALATLGKQ